MIIYKRDLSLLVLAATVMLSACTGGSPATPSASNTPASTPTITQTPATNRAPVANAGTNQSVNPNAVVTLDGSASFDPDGNAITYAWTLTSKPSGSSAQLTNATSAKPSFTPDVTGTYVVQLIVNDGVVTSPATTVSVSVSIGNRAPVANAGSNQSTAVGSLVTLNGSASSDPDGNTITYSWSLTSKPSGSTAILTGANTAKPTFTPTMAGSYVAQLIVSDGMLNSLASTTTINVAANTPVVVACDSLKPEFQSVTWGTVLKTNCALCHTNATAFSLVPETSTGFNNTNFDSFKATAAKSGANGASLILARASTNLGGHAGGAPAPVGSDAYNKLADMVAKVTSCTDGTVTTQGVTTGVVNGSGYYRLRKATLTLDGRLPTAAEEAAVNSASSSDAAITTAINTQLDGVMNEAGFYVRLKEIYNDMLLTDYYAINSRALSELDLSNFANGTYFDTANLTGADYSSADAGTLRAWANYGLARAPVELVAYVVANNRPFTEIVTADYVMVNSYSATLFGASIAVDTAFKYGDALTAHNPNVFMPAKLTDAKNGPYEHAGILSTLPFLQRYPSTATNRNRARARYTFEFFLDTDVQALADRSALNFDNVIGQFPTMSDPQCSVCHNVVDPVAGLFKNYGNRGVFSGNVTNWYNTRNPREMLDPGYSISASDVLPTSQSPKALQFLGARIAQDDRFVTATVKTLLRGMTGPVAADDTAFVEQLKLTFKSSNYNMKALVKAVVASNEFKAVNLGSSENPLNSAYATLGMPVLSTPEQLDRKITAITGGYQWKSPGNGTLKDANNYMLLYGGIDSMNVTERTREPTSLMASIQQRIAYQTACAAVPADFAKAAGSRALFPNVAITDLPDNGTGTSRIKQNIQYLHKRVLGEELALNDAEITRTYNLFVAAKGMYSGSNIPVDCAGALTTTDPIRVDANATVRSWMAVTAYLMMDYKFLFE